MSQFDTELLKKHFPFESNFVTIAGHQMHYIDEGKDNDEVVLLLHGNPTWSFYYRNLINTLKSEYRVIAPDLIGMGLSDHPKNSSFRANDRIEHIQEFVNTLKLEKFSIVMHDWGGSIGTGVAVRNVERINRLIYLNTTLTVTESLPGIIKRAATPLIGKFLTKTTKRFLKLTTELGVVNKLSKEIKKCYLLPYKTRARRKAIWDFVADIPFDNTHPSYTGMLDLAKRINDLSDVPIQIIWGLKDPCFHRDMLNNVAALFPQARVTEIPDASHLVLEDAEEITCKTIYEFLKMPQDKAMQPMFSAIDRPEDSTESNALYDAFMRTVEKSLYTFAAIQPSYLIDEVKYRQLNYKDLNSLINKYQRGLTRLGMEPGDKVLMLVSPGVDFLALSYAIMGRGAIPVFLDPGMGKDKLIECIEELEPDVFIGSPKAQLLKLVKPKVFKTIKFQVVATEWTLGKGASLGYLKKFADQALPPVKNNGTVLIAYTSGATGRPKGVVFDNENIKAQLDIFSNIFGLEAGKKDLPLLPIFSLYNLALGVTSVFAPINPSKPLDLDPKKIVKIINDLNVNYSFGSPTLWKKIAEFCFRSRINLESISKIFMAGAPVPPETIKILKDVIPNGKSYTPYGATEALPVTLISGQEILDTEDLTSKSGEQGTLVGKTISPVKFKIVEAIEKDIQDISQTKELDNFEIGEVLVQGANISKRYFKRPDIDAISKIKDGDGFWHTIGDMAYRDPEGNIFFCGRKAHRVILTDKILHSDPCENIFNQHEKVYRSALVQLNNSEPAIVIEPFPEAWPDDSEKKRVFVNELKELGLSSKITNCINRFFFHPSFPVDGRHNAKIFRDKLGQWASEQDQKLKAA